MPGLQVIIEAVMWLVLATYFAWSSARLLAEGRPGRALWRLSAVVLFLLVPYLLVRLADLSWARWLMVPGIVMLFLPVFADRRRRALAERAGDVDDLPPRDGGASPSSRQDP